MIHLCEKKKGALRDGKHLPWSEVAREKAQQQKIDCEGGDGAMHLHMTVPQQCETKRNETENERSKEKRKFSVTAKSYNLMFIPSAV